MRMGKPVGTFLFSVCLFIIMNNSALAAPANDVFRTVEQPDGTTFLSKAVGDEFRHWVETEDGHVILQGKDDYWYFAKVEGSKLTKTTSKVGIDSVPKNAALNDQVVSIPPKIDNKLLKQKQKEVNFKSNSSTKQDLIVLLVNFKDTKARYTENDWSTKIFSQTGNSLNTFYAENSAGKFQFTPAEETGGVNNGVVSVQLNYNHPDPVDKYNEVQLYRQIVANALIASDGMVNYRQFDKNGDGYISVDELHIVTIVAGGEGSYNDPSPRVWGHKYGLFSEAPTLDGVSVGNIYANGGYTQFGEKHGNHMATIGIIAHELGHDLGLPDLYDRDGSSLGVDVHSIMASGSWAFQTGEYHGQTPTHLDPWSKIKLGFVSPEVVYSSKKVNLNSIKNGNYNIVQIKTSDPSEYFLMENRQYSGYDRGLENRTVSGGIALWHIDEDQNRAGNDDENHKLVDLEEANEKYGSDLDSLKYYVDYNHYYRKGYEMFFNNETTPNTKLYNGLTTKLAIEVMDYSNDTMGVAINLGDDKDIKEPNWPADAEIKATEVGKESLKLSWTPATDESGIAQYEIYEGGKLIETVSGDVESTELSNLTSNTSYTFKIEAADVEGNTTTNGPSLTVKTEEDRDTKEPVWPMNAEIKATEVGKESLKLSWTSATDESGIAQYEIYEGGKLIKTVSGDVESTELFNLTPNTSYTFKIEAADIEGNTTMNGPSLSVKTEEDRDTKKPVWPMNAEIKATEVGRESLKLSWTSATDESGIAQYKIYKGDQLVKSLSGDVLSMVVTGLKENSSYTFRVEAADPTGNIAKGPTLTVETKHDVILRLEGEDRFGTAAEVSRHTYKTAETVVIARGHGFPDALAGAPLAYKLKAPILLSGKRDLSLESVNEIKRLGAKKAIILGGTSAVPKSVKDQLDRMGLVVQRIDGKDRFETAAKIADKLGTYKQAIIAYGLNFPDALSIAPYAAQHGYPILLTKSDELPATTREALTGISKTIVVGGSNVVSNNIFKKLPNPTRYEGANRYGTAAAIVKGLYKNYDTVYVASGANYPDALTGSVAAAQNSSPMYLVKKDVIPEETSNLIQNNQPYSYVILGGEAAISKEVEEQMK
ncbi:cell wall-binding repeat-containing protein [Bacillus sp. NTK071]|uniref:cell wall-binding repeat-containing protein n=1 Tax=Bacillus sp. NTK071 TaxID=2802175 RepID=UPI001A907383|nr:cell wall-binding repeat-containing protein [Bacillus sp. NTK071]MBN8210302.1 cell wall-binding repeat-containing protein [Bacillus sp. NTK071]